MITKPTKYTREFVFQEVRSMLADIRKSPDIFFLGQVFETKDYSMQRFSEWKKDFEDDEEISEAIKKIREVLESRVVVSAMKKELNPAMVIFHLKNNHWWRDKAENGENENKPIEITWSLSPEQKVKIAQNYINSAQSKETILYNTDHQK